MILPDLSLDLTKFKIVLFIVTLRSVPIFL